MSGAKFEVFHLSGKRMCNRAVRVRELSEKQQENVEKAAASSIDPQTSTLLDLQRAVQTLGMRSMITGVSEPCAADQANTAKMRDVDIDTLAKEWDSLFGPRDTVALRGIYDSIHVVSRSEVDAIMGKAIPFAG